MGLLDEKFFKTTMHKYITVIPCKNDKLVSGRNRPRIEVLWMPPKLEARALVFTMPCVACGAAIYPFRERQGRSRGSAHGIYYASSCPQEVSRSCSRGKAAKEEIAAIALYYGK